MSDIDRRRGKYVARWREPSGRQRSKSFDRAGDARRYLTEINRSMDRGVYVDPTSRLTLAEYSAGWLAARIIEPTTRETLERKWKLHILPHLGAIPLAQIRPSTVEAWQAGLIRSGLSAAYVREVRKSLSAALGAKGAVRDEL